MNKFKTAVISSLLALFLILLSACGSSSTPKLEGEWKAQTGANENVSLVFDKDTVSQEDIQAAKMDRGKWSFSVTAIRKGYSKLPSNVKRWINQYIGLNSILSTLEHFTGWIEDGIYQACKRAGMPDWMAWTVAKALTLIAL